MKLVSLLLHLVMATAFVVTMAVLFIITVPLWILGGLAGAIALPFHIAFTAMYELSAERTAKMLKRINPKQWARVTGAAGEAFEPSSLGRN